MWILGDLDDDDRTRGMGIVVEFAGAVGRPRWEKPKLDTWNYTMFGKGTATAPDETIDMLFEKNNAALNGFNQWTINGTAFSMDKMTPLFHISKGRRYRVRMRNASDDIHPVHLHRHSLRADSHRRPADCRRRMKDLVMLGGYQDIEFDFIADNPGMTLFHCHQQLHMDFGFMAR